MIFYINVSQIFKYIAVFKIKGKAFLKHERHIFRAADYGGNIYFLYSLFCNTF